MMNMLYLHHRKESDNYRERAAIISEGREYGIPVILEALPFNIGRADEYTVENIGFAAPGWGGRAWSRRSENRFPG